MSQRTFQLSVLVLLLAILAIGVLILVTLRASQPPTLGSSTASPGQSALEATQEYFDAAAAGDLGRYLAVVECDSPAAPASFLFNAAQRGSHVRGVTLISQPQRSGTSTVINISECEQVKAQSPTARQWKVTLHDAADR